MLRQRHRESGHVSEATLQLLIDLSMKLVCVHMQSLDQLSSTTDKV